MIKISVIIPIYNVERYLTSCLDSVVNQTMTEGVECILVDDCGKDRSVDIAKDYIANYKGNISFRLIHHEKNGGLSAARNTGIKAAKGEYVYFLDSDDEITPYCMERMWGMIEEHGRVDLVQGAFYEDEKEASTISHIKFSEFSTDRKTIKTFLLQYYGDIVGAQSRLIKLSFLEEHGLYFREGIIHEDNFWTFFLAKYVGCMAYCNVRTYYHRYNPNSITVNVNIPKEVMAYRCIIKNCSQNIDSFLPGAQKEWLLNNLITVVKERYYGTDEDYKLMVEDFCSVCYPLEKILLKLYLASLNRHLNDFLTGKLLHLLIRIFKIKG